MITFDEIYKICQRYGKRKCKNAYGGTYLKPSPKICAEKIFETIKKEQSNKEIKK